VLGHLRLEADGAPPASSVVLGVRPEHTRVWNGEPGLVGPIEGTVEYAESHGRETLVGVVAPADSRFVVVIDGLVHPEPGSTLRFGLRRGWLYLFDAESGRALGRV
jgi:hypothetical protein